MRFHHSILSTTSLALLLASTRAAFAQPDDRSGTDSSGPTRTAALDFGAQLDSELSVPGGLTAELVASRAVATSFDVRARRAEVLEAAAGVDRALAAYLPRLSLGARYTRLSDAKPSAAGSILLAPNAPAGPVAPG